LRPRLPFPFVALVLAATSIPGLIAQARDVDVLLYMAAAARANALHALPYAAAWIEKGPLAMAVFQLTGRNAFVGVSIAWLALSIAGAWLSAALAREAGATWADGWAALAFAIGIGTVGGTLNTEGIALVPAAAALLLWCKRAPAWQTGLLAGAAFLCRQNAGALLPILLALEIARGGGVRRAAILLGSFAVPVALTMAIYAAAGEWSAFSFCFWKYNTSIYLAATHVTGERILRIPWDATVSFLWPVRTSAALAVAGLVLAVPRTKNALALAAVAAGLLLAVIPGFRFFTHYAALALPMVAALAAVGLESIVARAGARGLLVVALAAFSWGLELTPRGWLDTGARLVRWTKARDEWPGADDRAIEVARWLRDHSNPSDRVFVWGMRPHILVYADRVLATRFTTCTFLTGLVPWERVAPYEDTTPWIVPGAWDLLTKDLNEERPRFIVDASMDHHFGDGAYPPSKFPPLQAILDRDYARVHESGETDHFVVWERKP